MKVIQILRGLASLKPSLHDGEFYLEKDTGVLALQNGESEIRFATKADIQEINNNIIQISNTLGQKLTTPTGTKGQVLGYVEDNEVGAVDAGGGGGGGGSNQASGTLTTTWSGSAGAYTQQISIAGITADDIPIVFPQITTTAQQTAWNTIQSKVESGAGWIKFYSTATTSTAVPFIVMWGI